MNDLQSRKRNIAFTVWFIALAVFLVLLLVLPLLPPAVRPPKPVYMSLVPISAIILLIFWFKGLYHWARSKGCPGALALIGILGFPIAVIIMAVVKDHNAAAAADAQPSQACPSCGAPYRLTDYDPAAKHIFCSTCKSELTKK
jgi:hypothetical protein